MATYIPRLSENSPTQMRGNPWWFSTGNIYYPDYGLPNCTCYAYGRFAEIRGAFAPLSGRNARYWYEHNDSFERGSTPRLGAVACYSSNLSPADYPGHVAIVERIERNGDIVLSESGWQAWFFKTETATAASNWTPTWLSNKTYFLQGFIYNDAVTPAPPIAATWHAKANDWGYSRTSNEAQENALMIYQQLYSLGWTLNAVAALLGNIEVESGYNPWLWENNIALNSTDIWEIDNSTVHGYGLVQFTPAGTYIHNSYAVVDPNYNPHFADIVGSPSDGAAQIALLNHEESRWVQRHGYNISFSQFKHSDSDVAYLTRVFLWNYEYPANPDATAAQRISAAQYWFSFLYQYDPGAIIIPTKKKRSKLWMYVKRRW